MEQKLKVEPSKDVYVVMTTFHGAREDTPSHPRVDASFLLSGDTVCGLY